MDKAAVRGRLDIPRALRARRTERCSTAAFVGAAANGYCLVLNWLYEFYHELRDPARDLAAAAENEHISVINLLVTRYLDDDDDVMPALIAAATNGHVAAVKMFMDEVDDVSDVFIIAARNDHVVVLRLLLKKREYDCNPAAAFSQAVQLGMPNAVKFMAKHVDIGFALETAIRNGRTQELKTMLELCDVGENTLGCVLQIAAEGGLCEMVTLVLGKFPTYDGLIIGNKEARLREYDAKLIISRALIEAAKAGHVDVVKILANRVGRFAGEALWKASLKQQWKVVEVLLQLCGVEDLNYYDTEGTVRTTMESAAMSGNVSLGQLLIDKFENVDTGSALKHAVASGHLEMVQLLGTKSVFYHVVHVDALVAAALDERFAAMEVLLDNTDVNTIEEALVRIGSSEKIEMIKLMLKKCDRKGWGRIFADAAASGRVGLVRALVHDVDIRSVRRALTFAA